MQMMKTFSSTSTIEKVIKLWQKQNLTLEGKITVFKALAMSKIVHLALITNIPTLTMKELNKIKKEFIWKNKYFLQSYQKLYGIINTS